MARTWFAGSSATIGATTKRRKGVQPTPVAPAVPTQEYDPADIQARYDVRQSTAAMRTTQKRAAADRAAALEELKRTRGEALGEFAGVPEDVISEGVAGKMFAGQRDVLEGQRAAQLRNIQRSFYGGGSAPSGAMLSASMATERGHAGGLATAKREIDIKKALENWQSRFGLAREKAGIRTDIAPHMVDVYGSTIAEVPELGGIAPELQPQKTKKETYGRVGGETNIDFFRRDPKGYAKWSAATSGKKGQIRSV